MGETLKTIGDKSLRGVVDSLTLIVEKGAATVDWVFTEHPLVIDVLSMAFLLCLGDLLVQTLENISGRNTWIYDFVRTRRAMIVGLVMGVFNHYWYTYLDYFIVGATFSSVIKKVACDQAVAGVFFNSAFLVGMGVLEGRTARAVYQEWRFKFWGIYKTDLVFWPTSQLVNFSLVPDKFRVIYVNFATLVWNVFLNYTKHQGWVHKRDHRTRRRLSTSRSRSTSRLRSIRRLRSHSQPATRRAKLKTR